MLEKLGYTVIPAARPEEAIRSAEGHQGQIHLILTDVVMPEMTGRDLAERLLAQDSGLKCLYMSGYTANVIAHHGVLDAGVHFIPKPFSVQDLADKIREALID
jgi:CheY-like chemotaxis protein